MSYFVSFLWDPIFFLEISWLHFRLSRWCFRVHKPNTARVKCYLGKLFILVSGGKHLQKTSILVSVRFVLHLSGALRHASHKHIVVVVFDFD